MGWPAIIGMALAAGGTAMQMKGQADASRAEEQAAQDEMARQKKYQGQADTAFNMSLTKSGTDVANKDIQQGANKQEKVYQSLAQLPLPVSAASATPTSTVTEARIAAGNDLRQNTQARMQGYGTFGMNQQIKDLLAAQQLAGISQAAGRSGSVLPLELQQASHAGDAWSGSGKLVGLAGSLVGGLGSLYTTPATIGANTAGYQNIGQGYQMPSMSQGFWNGTMNPGYGSLVRGY